MSDEGDGERWMSVGIYGTHLFAVPAGTDLDAVDEWPPDEARTIDVVPSRAQDPEDREPEFERAARRFRDRVDEVGGDEMAVVAVGVGQRFQFAPAEVFFETFGSEGC